MFTRADYQEYFETILKKEKEMTLFIKQFTQSLSDESLVAQLNEILRDEIRHTQLAAQLLEQLTS